jgi:small subunit ribosomal protein S17
MSQTANTTTTETRPRRKVKIGKVISNKAEKTIVVAVERQVAHPLYKKYFKKTATFMAHDEANACGEGDIVRIMETRPLSARKRWRLVEIIEKAK